MFYRRIEIKLGVTPLRSDRDLARLVDERLPLASVESLCGHGLSAEEIYSFIIPRRSLVHRKSRHESLTDDESDRAVRIARMTSLTEEVFGDEAKTARWLRKAKTRFEGRSPLEMLRTELLRAWWKRCSCNSIRICSVSHDQALADRIRK